MEVGVRELRNQTARVIDAVKAGEKVTLTVRGEPIADIVPHQRRQRYLSGKWLREHASEIQADPGLADQLRELLPETLEDLDDPWQRHR